MTVVLVGQKTGISMTMRFEQAKVLVAGARRRLAEVDALCDKHLQNPARENLLLVQEATKEVLDKLRSALDFCASEWSAPQILVQVL
jgi:hypothetical protein